MKMTLGSLIYCSLGGEAIATYESEQGRWEGTVVQRVKEERDGGFSVTNWCEDEREMRRRRDEKEREMRDER